MLRKQALGATGPLVGCLGYGAMVHEGYYGAVSEDQGIAVTRHALDLGMTMIDTADSYGQGHNETLVGHAIEGRRNEAFIATKFGIVFDPEENGTEFQNNWNAPVRLNGTAGYARRALDRSLKRLKIDTIDLWYLHYPDPVTPIEESVEAMAQAVKDGKVRFLGLSNVTPELLRRAHSIHPITAVQYEYSLWRSEAEYELIPTLRELGVALVAWAPLGAGFLTGTLPSAGDAAPMRQIMPRFTGGNFEINQRRFAPLMAIAAELSVTPAQLALAWLLRKGHDVFPIPGTRRADRVTENAHAANLSFDEKTWRRIDEFSRPGIAAGINLL